MALATSKASVAFLILRIMGTSTWRRYFLYFLVAANFLFCSLAIIFTFAQCRPSRALWDHSIDGKCWNPKSQSSFSLMAGSKDTSLPSRKALLTPGLLLEESTDTIPRFPCLHRYLLGHHPH